MAVLTISREVGSKGTYIGQRVADALDYRFVDKEVIELILRDYGMQLPFRKLYDSESSMWAWFDRTRAATLDMLNNVILALAHSDNVVILGRGGYAVLQGYADVLNVRVQAPFESRVVHAQKTFGTLDRNEAVDLLRDQDRLRTTFVESSYRLRWDDCGPFDLVYNTGKIDPDQAVTWLLEAIETMDKQDHGIERTTHSIKVDSVLAQVIAWQFPELQTENV